MMSDFIMWVPPTNFGNFFNGLALFMLYHQEGSEISVAVDAYGILVGNDKTRQEVLPPEDVTYLEDLGWTYDDIQECWKFWT